MPIVTGLLNPPNSVHGLGMGLLNRSAGPSGIQFVGSATGGRTDGAEITTVTTDVNAGEYIIIGVVAAEWDSTSEGLSDNNGGGGTYTLYQSATTTVGTLFCYIRNANTSSTASTNFSVTNINNTAIAIGILRFTGVTAAAFSEIVQDAAGNGSSGDAPEVSFLSPTSSANMIVVLCGSGDTTTTPPINFTERLDTSQSTPTTALEMATRLSGHTADFVIWGATASTDWAAIGLEIEPD